MAKWNQLTDEVWDREDRVTVRFVFSHGKKPWVATRNRTRGAPHHRADKEFQYLRRQSPFGSWGVIRQFETAAACMKAADKDWPLKTPAAKRAEKKKQAAATYDAMRKRIRANAQSN